MPEQKSDDAGHGLFGRVWARFGEVARNLGIVHEHDVSEALEHQEGTDPRKKLGEILVEKGKMTRDHVEAVLKEQRSASARAEAKALIAKAPEAGKPGTKAGKTTKKKPPKKKAPKKAAKKPKKKAARRPKGKAKK